MRILNLMIVLMLALPAFAQEDSGSMEPAVEFGRDPAALPSTSKRSYPGAADDEDLRVLNTLPEAPLKTDARGIQKEVFKSLYNQELKDDRPEAVEE